jgi:hypothetical protein
MLFMFSYIYDIEISSRSFFIYTQDCINKGGDCGKKKTNIFGANFSVLDQFKLLFLQYIFILNKFEIRE